MMTRTTCLIAVLLTNISLLAQQQTRPQPPANPEAGFTPMFDGKSLAGWDGDTKYWRAENGCLVGEITPGNEIKQNTFIVWQGGKPADFELRCEYRISDKGNSGINYRSSLVEDQKHVMKGYQFDLDGLHRNSGDTRHSGNNYEERGRTFMALRGQFTHAIEDGKREILGTIGDYKELSRNIKNEDWNSVAIIARSNTMIHMINGQVMSILTDDDVRNRKMDGLIGVQVHVGGPMKVEFRNLRLKKMD